MTVYELIQELSQYNADTEVEFNIAGEIDVDVEAEFDRDNDNDVQDVTVTADLDDSAYFDDISNYERSARPSITVNLTF